MDHGSSVVISSDLNNNIPMCPETVPDDKWLKKNDEIVWVVGDVGDNKSCDTLCSDKEDMPCSQSDLYLEDSSDLKKVCEEILGLDVKSGHYSITGSAGIDPVYNNFTRTCSGTIFSPLQK